MRTLAALAVLLPACLPSAEAPSGTRLSSQRGLAGLGFSRGGQQPGTALLFSRAGDLEPGDDDDPSLPLPRDLFVMARGGGEARRLATHVVSTGGNPQWDARGRVYVQHHQATTGRGPPVRSVTRFDLATGDAQDLGRARTVRLSPTGRRLYYEAAEGAAIVRDDGDHDRLLGTGLRQVRFLGEDVAYLAGKDLRLLAAGDEQPRTLQTPVTWWRPAAADGTRRRILFTRPSARGAQVAFLYLDPPADAPEVRPVADTGLIGDPAPSRDGARVALLEHGATPDRAVLRVIDVASGDAIAAELALPPAPPCRRMGDAPLVEIEFRPGSAEVWSFVNERLHVLRPDGSLLVATDARHGRVRIGRDDGFGTLLEAEPDPVRTVRPSIFTADGRRWLYQTSDGRLILGDADDPAADAGLALGDAQDTPTRNLAELDGGRRLALWLAPGRDRTDLHLVDVAAPARRLLAADVTQVSFGQRRALVVARVLGRRSFAPGELLLVDLDGSPDVTLGGNVTEFTVEPVCSRCDGTGAGVTAAFVVQARVPFQYDGLYLSELP